MSVDDGRVQRNTNLRIGPSRRLPADLAFAVEPASVPRMPKSGGPSKEARMARTDISWAGRLDEVVGGGRPGFILGAPDAQAAGIGDRQAVTFSAWRDASDEGLAAGTCIWNQRNLCTSSEESSRYELDCTLDASLQVP
jgi:hypothetical protein